MKPNFISEEQFAEMVKGMNTRAKTLDGVKEHTPNGGGGGGAATERRTRGTLVKSSARTPQATTQSFFVPGPLPGQNTFMGNGNRWTYGKAKKQWAVRIGLAIQEHKLRPMQRVHITWAWVERNTRRDPDNFTGISKKFILDTLVSTGILPDDGWDEIAGWTDSWSVDWAAPGVLITLESQS